MRPFLLLISIHNKQMKPESILKKITKVIKNNLKLIVYLISLIIIAWFAYYNYNTLYSNIIAQKEIDKSEIIAKKQKVNIDLLNKINTNIIEKKESLEQYNQEILSPFK